MDVCPGNGGRNPEYFKGREITQKIINNERTRQDFFSLPRKLFCALLINSGRTLEQEY